MRSIQLAEKTDEIYKATKKLDKNGKRAVKYENWPVLGKYLKNKDTKLNASYKENLESLADMLSDKFHINELGSIELFHALDQTDIGKKIIDDLVNQYSHKFAPFPYNLISVSLNTNKNSTKC